MLSDEKSTSKGAAGRKPLKRFVKQPGEKVGGGASDDSPADVKPLKDDIFMLEKTDYSSGSSIHELDNHDHSVQNRRQSQFQRNGNSSLPFDSEGHVVPAMRSSAQKVQHLNRAIGGGGGGGGGRRLSSMPPSEGESSLQQQHIFRGNAGVSTSALGNRMSRSSRVQQYLDSAYMGGSTSADNGTSRTTSSGGSPHSRSSSSGSSGGGGGGAFEHAETHRSHAPLHSLNHHRYHSPFSW